MNQRHLPMRSIEEYHCNLFRGCDTHIKLQDLRVSVMCAGAYQNCVQMGELRAKCGALQLQDQQTRGRISNPRDTSSFERTSMRTSSACKESSIGCGSKELKSCFKLQSSPFRESIMLCVKGSFCEIRYRPAGIKIRD